MVLNPLSGAKCDYMCARRVQAKKEKRAARRSKVADHKAQALAAKLRRSPETREGVHAFHARRRAVEVPYDPGMDVAICATGRRVPGRRPTRRTRRNV